MMWGMFLNPMGQVVTSENLSIIGFAIKSKTIMKHNKLNWWVETFFHVWNETELYIIIH